MKQFKARGAGVIFYIVATDQFMFFLRDDKDTIPFPNMVDILGGHMEEGEEDPRQTALRELAEELEDAASGKPFQPTGLSHFKTWVDERNVEQTVFGCELKEKPHLRLKEGQRLVFLGRDELATIDFAFGFGEVVQEYAASVK